MELNGISFGSFHLELFSTADKNSESWPQFYTPLVHVKSIPKVVHFLLFAPWKSLHLCNFSNHSTPRWSFLPALCPRNPEKSSVNLEYMATTRKKKISQSLCFASLVWKAHAHKQRERRERMHSWINQRHYHQRWRYGFVVALIGYSEATELMCTVNWDKFCLAQYKSRSETKKIQLTALRAAVSGQYGPQIIGHWRFACKLTFIDANRNNKGSLSNKRELIRAKITFLWFNKWYKIFTYNAHSISMSCFQRGFRSWQRS